MGWVTLSPTLKNAGEGETYSQWKQIFPKVEAQDLCFQWYFPSLSHLSHSEPQSKRNQVWKSSSALPVPPVLKPFLLVLGHPKGQEGSRAGSLSLQERAVKYGLTCPGKGRCTMNCSAVPALSTQTLLGKFNSGVQEWGFTCHKLPKFTWVTISLENNYATTCLLPVQEKEKVSLGGSVFLCLG